MDYAPVSKRKREEEAYYSNLAKAISPDPKVLVLRYEDAAVVTTAYVNWKYIFTNAIQGYSRVKLLNISGYNNYSSDRLSMIGINFDEFPNYIQTGGTGASGQANPLGPTFCVRNQQYNTTSFTMYSWEAQTDDESPALSLGAQASINQLTVTLRDGVGPALTASGTPAGYFNDMTLLFYN